MTEPVSAQLAAGSPSEAVTVSVNEPALPHLNVGVGECASLSVPPLEVQM
jgi:hypothetical protein